MNNTVDRLKETVSEGIKTVESKISQLEADIAEKKEEMEKQAKKKERARRRKRIWLKMKRTLAIVLAVLVVAAGGAWYAADLLNGAPFPLPVEPLWALMLIALGAVTAVTGKFIPVKIGVALFGVCVLARSNGWLRGILEGVPLLYILFAIGVIVAAFYVIRLIVGIKNGTRRTLKKAKKAVAEKTENIRDGISEKLNKSK